MNAKILSPLILAAAILAAKADDEKFPLLKVGGDSYTNVTVTSVSATDIYFIHAGGTANVKLKNLPPELQKRFNFDPAKARAAELKQAESQAKFHEQLIRQPVVHPPDMTRDPAAPLAAPEAVWRTDLPGALQQARAEKKVVLLDFTGSDWCPWCIKFDQDVLSTGKFAKYAKARLVLVKLDFPRQTPQGDDLKRANAALAKQFKVDGFPTYILLDADGKELGRVVGYLNGGPDAFTAKLDSFNPPPPRPYY